MTAPKARRTGETCILSSDHGRIGATLNDRKTLMLYCARIVLDEGLVPYSLSRFGIAEELVQQDEGYTSSTLGTPSSGT
jgi:hypothetical protein